MQQISALPKILMLLACGVCSVTACIYQYGARHEVPHYSYGYVGLDWPSEYPTCTGALQSPIHIPGHTGFQAVARGEHSIFDFGTLASTGSNVKVVNNGHTVQVVFPADYTHNASVVAKGEPSTTKLISKFALTSGDATRVKLRPAQFHFHTHSEHTVDGKEYPLEMHIVNFVKNDSLPGCGGGGCATVVGILFELYEDDVGVKNKFIDTVFNTMSSFENVSSWLPSGAQLNFNDVLPADRSYVTYSGSLTTPPCTEGILWHLLTTPVKITRDQLHQFEMAVGDTDCTTVAVERAAKLESGTLGSGSAAQSSRLENGGPSASTTSTTAAPSASTTSTSAALSASTTSTTAASAATQATTSGMKFEVPDLIRDAKDGLTCHKLATGHNYREIQDRGLRPIQFYAAPGLCSEQLDMLADRSKVLSKVLNPTKSNKTITLAQYNNIVEAGLTQAAQCGGITSGAVGHKGLTGVMLQLLLAGLGALLLTML